MYAATSSFIYNASLKNAAWSRKLLIGSSDYTAYVSKWPSIKKAWDALSPQTATIDLSNEGKTFNFLTTDPTKMQTTVTVKLGFASSDYITMFAGTIDAVRYGGGGCSITLIDKFRRLADRKVGDSTSAVNYTGSSYLIHDMAWYAVTSLGGLSATVNSSNPDMHYDSFTSWTSVFSADNVRCKASFTGQQPIEILRKLAKLTQSAIFIEDNKLKFMRFALTNSEYTTLDSTVLTDATATLDDRELVNKSWVSGAYDTSSKTFGLTVYDVNSVSQVNYGLREHLMAETFVWLTDSASALNLAQRTIVTNGLIKAKYSMDSTLAVMRTTIGDTVLFTDALLEVSDTYRIMEESLDVDTGKRSFVVDQTQLFGGFRLDISALDSSDVLT